MTSLSALKTGGELFVELTMLRQAFPGSLLVLEGEDDVRFWRRHIVAADCEPVLAGGRRNVEDCVRRVDAAALRGALGVVDADFGPPPAASPNLLCTEHHDLEALLLQSSALDAVLIEYGDRDLIQRFEARYGRVREALVARGAPFGRLRWLSERHALGINFHRLGRSPYFDTNSWTLDVERLTAAAATLCARDATELRELLAALPHAPAWSLCQGHDMLHILNLGLTRALGTSTPGAQLLGRSLRLAFQAHEFSASSLYSQVRAWEARNSPYRVLPAHIPPTSPS